MNIKNKLISFFIFSSILTLLILNIKNNEKTKFYLFTSKTEEISLGNLIAVTFISGFTFGSLLTLISKKDLQESLGDTLNNDEEVYESDENNVTQELEYDRPPERDIRESQPTISVNYRFVDQEEKSYNSKDSKSNINIGDDDWLNNDNDW